MKHFLAIASALFFLVILQAQTPTILKDINAGAGDGVNFTEKNSYAQVNGKIVFAANDNTNGNELWVTDGTTAGTQMLMNINTGSASAWPRNFLNVAGQVFFVADNGTAGMELWKTDGTAAGTVLVKDINSGGAASYPNEMVALNNKLVFVATTDIEGEEVWISDGTASGTKITKDIYTGLGNNAEPNNLYTWNNKVYFSANDGSVGQELFVTDGTAAGTSLLKDINTNANYLMSSIGNFCALNSTTLLFSANGGNAIELWKTDGTAAGTVLVKDINATASWQFGSEIGKMVVLGSYAYFSAFNLNNGHELWKTDGTAANTAMVASLQAAGASSRPYNLVALGTDIYFVATDATNGSELFKSNGSTITLVKDINTGTTASSIHHIVKLKNKLYFSATEGSNGVELWQTDGTSAGTTMVTNLNAGAASSAPNTLVALNNNLFFVASNGTSGNELYQLKPCTTNTLTASNISFSFAPTEYTQVVADDCSVLFDVKQSGSQPLYGTIASSINFPASVQTFGSQKYVAKYYQIEPASNAASATATITLFYTQAQFNAYNLAETNVNRKLPMGPSDLLGIQRTQLVQCHGPGSNPTNHTGSTETFLGAGLIQWNATESRWEVTVNVNGFSGFYLSSISKVLALNTGIQLQYQVVQQSTHLNWSAATASGTYTIEQSSNGSTYTAIGNSATNFFVTASQVKQVWYRVKQTLASGAIIYSNSITLKPSVTYTLQPSFATSEVKLLGLSSTDVVQVFNSNGSLIKVQSGATVLQVGNWPSGIYSLLVNGQTTLRFVKQ